MIIIAYNGTQSEIDRITNEQNAVGFVLTHISNITEGDFLGFTEKAKIDVTAEQEISELKEQNLIIMDAIATLFETVIGGV